MKVILHRSFKKQYRKTSVKIRKKFEERLILFMSEPDNSLLSNHALHGDRAGQWSINVTGDWRAIYEVKDGDVVTFVDIDTHSNLY
jgi:addiction module RelE/StbE family toxin